MHKTDVKIAMLEHSLLNSSTAPQDQRCSLTLAFLWLCVRDSAAVDESRAIACFHTLLQSLDQQWKRSVQENNILKGPDFLGLRTHLIVGQRSDTTSCLIALTALIVCVSLTLT